jgi:O-antigen ligase
MSYFFYHILRGTFAFNTVVSVSQNSISIYILSALLLYSFASLQNRKYPSFLLLILSFIIVIWTGSRSSILSFGILVGVSFFHYLFKNKKNIFSLSLFFAIIFLIFIFNSSFNINLYSSLNDYFQDVFLLINRKTNISLFEDTRFVVIKDYLFSLSSFNSLFFGSKLSSINSIYNLDNNPHNMFILLHARFGILGFFLITILVTKSLFKLFNGKNYLLVLYLIVILIRGFSDSVGFWGIFDPFIFSFLFRFDKYTHDFLNYGKS